ncbi:unnamed protein product [Rotaria sp. Silwood2]|nr:unnamed protein product [Rotaria sp. Silwood2]CAF2501436.1 unnamed protein product [Rotaria sp. Silwood2]CAF2815885.1 unnamed protein product [Rotaria sp. Silwood2]CAF2899124.1 unnamed protein product [Rotaria sp. Silwood2]CAF4008159.1 unnamed protein product [Rotaria sp. Silwood2]
MATVQTLNYISQQLNIYLGLFMLSFGIIGAFWNILSFRHYSLRSSSYCTYMLFASITSLIHISFALSDRVIEKGFKIHWTANSASWCKIRYYVANCTSLITLSCFVFSAIDRFFSTCRQIKWRRLNSVFIARHICVFFIIFWMLITIPTLIYAKPIQFTLDKRLCNYSSIIWLKIITYFFYLCCYGIFPWIFMSLFGYLTLKNIRQIRNRRIGTLPSVVLSRMARIDDQLSSMLFLQIIVCIVSSMPFITQSIYESLTQRIKKDEYRLAQEYLFLQISRLVFYFNYISMFYVNYLSSPIFRQLSKRVVINLFKKNEDISRDITLINHQENNNRLERRNLKPFTIQPIVSISRV